MIAFVGSDEHLPLVDFAYNNSYLASIGMGPFKALYGMPCISLTCSLEGNEPLTVGPEFLQDSQRMVELIQQRLSVAQDRGHMQTSGIGTSTFPSRSMSSEKSF